MRIRSFFPAGAGLLVVLASTQAFGHGAARDSAADPDRRIEFPDTAEHQTVVVDLHTHSVFSDGHVWPKIRVEEALRDGLDALAITEHLEYQPHRADIPHPDRNAAIREAQAAAEATDLIIIPGSEITREAPAGHVNAVFISDANALLKVENPPADSGDPADPGGTLAYYSAANQWPAENAIEAANAQNAFVFWNHPYWTRQKPDAIARMNDFHRANIEAGKLHGIEIANGQDYSAESHQIALDFNLTLVGVSDVHDLIDWDYQPGKGGHRPVNLVLVKERTAQAIKQALFERRTLVWFRNLLIAREPEMNAMLAASLAITSAAYRPGTQVLDVTIANASDARFELRNTGKVTFMDHADRISVPPHGELSFSVKPGAVQEKISLTFNVSNALLAPRTPASITLEGSIAQP